MLDKTILELTDIGTLSGTEKIPVAKQGVNEDNNTSVSAIKTFVDSDKSVTDGTGADADKVTIQIKEGITAKVIKTHQDISGKADKVSGATSGNFAGLDGNGNLTDSGKKPADFILVADFEAMSDAEIDAICV